MEQEKLPEYIEEIATAKSAAAQRREIIRNEYLRLLEFLQRKYKKKAVFNNFWVLMFILQCTKVAKKRVTQVHLIGNLHTQ